MPLLEVQNVSKSFGGLMAVKDLSFDVNRDEVLGFIGPNGSGKSTTFNLIMGYYHPDSGSIKFKGEEIKHFQPHTVASKGIGRTFQLSKPLSKLTVLENVMAGGFLRDKNVNRVRSKAIQTLEFIGLDREKANMAGSLTTADRRLLELGRSLVSDPELLLIDEIAAGLNPTDMKDVMATIERIRKRGITIMLVEHVMKAVMGVSDRVMVIDHGEKIAEGTPQEVANNELVIQAYLGKEEIK